MNDSIVLTLNSPITEEQLDIITDVDLDNTPSVIFQTKHGKEVEYVKVVRCKDCKRWDGVPADETQDHECHLFDGGEEKIRIATPSYWFCPMGERRADDVQKTD